MASKHGRTHVTTFPVVSCDVCKIVQVNVKNPKETGIQAHIDVSDVDPFRMTRPFYIMRSSQLHGGSRRVNRWTTLALTIFLLTCPLVVLQVKVAPGLSPQLPPGLKGRTPGCWQVSSEGRCRNSRGGISHGTQSLSGYCQVNICRNLFMVHRLVAYAFLGPPPSEGASQVNHIDGNRSNNGIQNLEWVSHSENIRHSYATNPSRRNAMARPVMIRPLGSCNWTSFSSIKLAAEALSQSHDIVRRRCSRSSQVDGYEYKFAPVVEIAGEEWRPMIDPRSGRHVAGRMVSSQGRIKSKGGHISLGHSREDGYLDTRYVHRLVAAAFLGLPPSPEHSQVNHKDGNKNNNAVENLEYVTPAENHLHYANLRGRSPLSKAVLSRAYRTNEKWTAYPSMRSAAKTLGLCESAISACSHGIQKQTGGYEFRFAEPESHVVETLLGEEWRDVDLDAHLKDREVRKRRQRQRRHMKAHESPKQSRAALMEPMKSGPTMLLRRVLQKLRGFITRVFQLVPGVSGDRPVAMNSGLQNQKPV